MELYGRKAPSPAAKLGSNNGCHHLIPTNRIIMIRIFLHLPSVLQIKVCSSFYVLLGDYILLLACFPQLIQSYVSAAL